MTSMALPPLAPEDLAVYEARCQDVDFALAVTRERVEGWDRNQDPHGWWHERSVLIALHDEVVRLRSLEDQAEEDRSIVADLAAMPAPEGSRPDECALCSEPLRGDYETVAPHDLACPWRRSKEDDQ